MKRPLLTGLINTGIQRLAKAVALLFLNYVYFFYSLWVLTVINFTRVLLRFAFYAAPFHDLPVVFCNILSQFPTSLVIAAKMRC